MRLLLAEDERELSNAQYTILTNAQYTILTRQFFG